jgi:hypothetical protein
MARVPNLATAPIDSLAAMILDGGKQVDEMPLHRRKDVTAAVEALKSKRAAAEKAKKSKKAKE